MNDWTIQYRKECSFCKREYFARHNRALFCSPSCREKAYRKTYDAERRRIYIQKRSDASAKSFAKKTREQKLAVWNAKNKKRSDATKLKKYGTTDPNLIKAMKNAAKGDPKKLRKERDQKRYKTDREFYVKSLLYRRMNHLLKYRRRGSHMVDYLGCSVDELLIWIESKFTEGMTWENRGRYGWHLDHIKPCKLFDFSKEEDIKDCFHYTNLQPLWANDNLRKSAKFLVGSA
jgi:hypothetical protein